MVTSANQQAQIFAKRCNLPGTVGSDAHTAQELGTSVLLLPEFHDAASLRLAMPQSQRITAMSPAWVHWFSRMAVWRKALPGWQKKATGW
jgi:hypothetical protein